MIVVDASVIVEVIIGSVGAADRLAGERLVAPAIVDGEAGSAVRRQWRHGSLDDERASIAIGALGALEIMRFEHRALLPRAWELRHNLTFTDGLYVALAEQLGIPLVTLDARIATAPRLAADVEVLARTL
ncbi:MAG: type II toxin-antitoxin system VapC family toxin [Pseudonocardiaceae bacterium]